MTGCPLLDSEYAARKNGKRLPCERLTDENAKLRELVRALVYASNPSDRATIICNAAELMAENAKLGIEVDA